MRVDRPHRRLLPAPLTRPAPAHDRPQDIVAVAEDVGGDLDGVALAALGWIASAVDPRQRLLDADARRRMALGAGGLGLRGAWHDLILHHLRSSWREPLNLPAIERRPAARDFAARRSPRAVRVRVCGLARRRRPVVVAGASARPTGPPGLALPRAFGVRGLARPARRPGRPCRTCGGGRVPQAARLLDRRLGASGRRARRKRPGALRTRVEQHCAPTRRSAACG